jgi:hypothetical protein
MPRGATSFSSSLRIVSTSNLALVATGLTRNIYSRSSGPHDKQELAGLFAARDTTAENRISGRPAAKVGIIDLVNEAVGNQERFRDWVTLEGQ